MTTTAQPLQGDTGPIQTVCNVAAAAVTLDMCAGLAQTVANPGAVAPASLAHEGGGLLMLGGMASLLKNIM